MNNNDAIPQLEELEALVYANNLNEAATQLLHVLQDIDVKRIGIVPARPSAPQARDYQQLQLTTRLAAVATYILGSKSFAMSQPTYELFMVFKKCLHAIFMASGFGDMDHLHWHMAEHDANGQSSITSDSALRKMLLAVTPNSPQDQVDYSLWAKSFSLDLALPFWLSFIGAEIVISKQAFIARQKMAQVYNEISIPKDYCLSTGMLTRASNAWMMTSYMSYREKHHPKKFLNKLFRQYGEKMGIKEPALKAHKPHASDEHKPRLVIASEHFTSSHAMYRCYRRYIDSLREHFYTLCLCIDSTIDDNASAAFDEVHTFERGESIRKVAGKMVKLKPDMVYYPSLGMQNWTVVLAQFRFAPIQFMTLGHPASSMTTTIDYVLAGKADLKLFSERIVYTEKFDEFYHVPHPHGQDFTYQPKNKQCVRIAVNAKLYKINYQLIEACQAIQERSKTPVEFVFFPACKGITYEAFRQELNRHLNAKVYPTTAYHRFIDRLRSCDMVLNPFPFGNTNGINDCARIGLPFVCMDGDEPHSRVDILMSKQLGYPEFLRTKNINDYIAAAVRLIDNSDLRYNIINNITSKSSAASITGNNSSEAKFAEVVNKLYFHHENIKKSKECIINSDELDSCDKKK